MALTCALCNVVVRSGRALKTATKVRGEDVLR
jgi:hypothetical protein